MIYLASLYNTLNIKRYFNLLPTSVNKQGPIKTDTNDGRMRGSNRHDEYIDVQRCPSLIGNGQQRTTVGSGGHR